MRRASWKTGSVRARSRLWRATATLISTAALVGAGLTGGVASAAPAPPAGSAASAAAIPAQFARVLAGQHVIYSYPGPTPPPELFEAVRAGEAAGVIFFSENIVSLEQIRDVAQALQDAAMASPVPMPLLLLTDQEGGEVRRLRLPGADWPADSAAAVGASADPAAAGARTGHEAAAALHAAGLTGNLAPVLGVYRTPGDFLDRYERSYSSDPAVVGAAAGAFIAAQQADGIAAAAKHFPGLGAAPAGANTDEEPVTIPLDAGTLRSVDEAPYRAAIDAGVDMVMPSWAVYPALDPGTPAGLSSTILRGDLRGALGYQGVIVSDAIEAGALAAFGDSGDRSVAALAAGQDLALCSARDAGQGAQATGDLAAAITGGRLDLGDVLVSTERVLALRLSLR
ncbi:glycoside hydrolase family 3 N-terminal domain-containing protein [Tomitella fengzijianii]|uniref:Beta-N-acetylhexosaminidase n=1 Tax=Tomitella fengzijianii TaxID=2597660 RepID=A0A516WZN6_9ACTN|nr:glycoside hydrolase family 3 N-terminal domain-containing protein [Tomitella fengzijianii]QDQ96326.1 beta-N-acetylhexosaminidase [Tomitella fengzijianii]